MKYKINKQWYIRAYDDNNWVIARMTDPANQKPPRGSQRQKTTSKTGHSEKFYGYFRTLQDAKEEAAELVAKQAEDIKELEKAIKLIKKI